MQGKRRKRVIPAVTAGILLMISSAGASEIVIPEGTQRIEEEAFANCGAVHAVVIPDSVTEIGRDAFLNCGEALLIRAGEGSAGAQYAMDNRLDYMAGTEYRALIIAQNYTGTVNALQGPMNDQKAMAWCLRELNTTPYSVTTETNLTPDEIDSAIGDCFAGADSNDVSLFYYSGHGETDGSLVGADRQFSLLTPDALRAALDRVPGRKVIIVDACYSGKLIEPEDGDDTLNKSPASGDAGPAAFVNAFQSAFQQRKRGALNSSSYYVITAARAAETSMEGYVSSGSSGTWIGYFTYEFCLGCGWNGVTNKPCSLAADANGDNAVSIQEAFNYASSAALSRNPYQHAAVWPAGCKWFAPVRK